MTIDKNNQPKNMVRFITATSLLDGHDVSINIFRRILQSFGAEVIHLGHNRSVKEIVDAAIEEDVQGVAVSCYQGGHVEFFKYMIDLLRKEGGSYVRVFGGGGVLGAMEWGYQRSKIQDESLLYEEWKHSGQLPIIGVNTFLNPREDKESTMPSLMDLSRSTDEEKQA